MIQLDYRDKKPIYEQIADRFRQLVLSGALRPGERIASVRELAQALSINPNTIQKAFRELEAQGYICTVQGKGSFVSSDVDKRVDMVGNELKEKLAKLAGEFFLLKIPIHVPLSIIKETYGVLEEGKDDKSN